MATVPARTEEMRTDSPPAALRRDFKTTRRRTVTRRGVMWLGQTCDARCYFCYFLDRIADSKHVEHPFMTLEKAKKICHTLRYFYGHSAIDIQGGEPTIHPEILELITYCHEIGLYPTLITNGLSLAKPGRLEEFRDAGVRDFLVSLHGLGATHDEVVCKKGASIKIIAAIERMVELGIPFRYNCTMSKPVVAQLPDIARKAVEYGANAVNYIAFNPFGDQQTGKRTDTNVARYSDIKPKLTEAMDILDEAGIECNVRYLPLCMAEERHRKNFFNMQQLTYDHHEWNYESWLWTMQQSQMMKGRDTTPPARIGKGSSRLYRGPLKLPGIEEKHGSYEVCHGVLDFEEKHPVVTKLGFLAQNTYARAQQSLVGVENLLRLEARIRANADCKYRYEASCDQCSCKNICDGFHGDYADFFGTGEAQPINGMPPTDDPLYYIKQQVKIVEKEDEAWAL